MSVVHGKDQELEEEMLRLARENAEFRQAIAAFQVVESRYDDARRAEGLALQASASIVDSVGALISSSLAVGEDEVVLPKAIEIVTPAGSLGSFVEDAAQAWAFEPATADGVPIDWHNNRAIIVFNREQPVHAAWPQFAETYEAVADLVSRGRYAEAKSRNERMRRELAVTLEEMAFAELQLAVIEHALGNPHAALDAIRRATEPAIEQLADEELKLALEHRFALELELGLAVDALETYERRIELGRVPSSERIARLGASLEQTLAAPETSLAAQGRIGGNGQWDHSLTWPTFAVGDLDGRIEGMAVVCNRGRATLPFEEDVQMAIPAGWGECALFVDGQPETMFIVYELKEPVN